MPRYEATYVFRSESQSGPGISKFHFWPIREVYLENSGLGRFRSVNVPGVDYWDLPDMVVAVREPLGEYGIMMRF